MRRLKQSLALEGSNSCSMRCFGAQRQRNHACRKNIPHLPLWSTTTRSYGWTPRIYFKTQDFECWMRRRQSKHWRSWSSVATAYNFSLPTCRCLRARTTVSILPRNAQHPWPDIRIIISSGQIEPKADDLPEGVVFVRKPLSADVFHDHLLQLLPDGKKPEPLKRRASSLG